MHITDTQLATYKEQGFLIVEDFLTPAEQQSALDGFFTFFAPPYDHYLANDRQNDTPRQVLFPWDHSGLNHVTIHPDLIDAAERILGTSEIRLGEGHLAAPSGTMRFGTWEVRSRPAARLVASGSHDPVVAPRYESR